MGDDAAVALSISQFFRNECPDVVALLCARRSALLSVVRFDPARRLLRDASRRGVVAVCSDHGFRCDIRGHSYRLWGPQSLLTTGPIIAGVRLVDLSLVDFRQPFWVCVFPPMVLLGVGMAITVPPLTSTVMGAAGKAHAGIASGVNNAVARIASLLAVAALGAVLFASFSYHLVGPTPTQANEAMTAVMSGQPGIHEETIAAFARALRAIMLVTATCAALAVLIGWLWTDPNGAFGKIDSTGSPQRVGIDLSESSAEKQGFPLGPNFQKVRNEQIIVGCSLDFSRGERWLQRYCG
jgi:hypothetical protein